MKKHLLLFLAITATTLSSQAQTAISVAGSPPDASAMFDVSATDKGMLIPRVALTSTVASAPITSPLTSLLVYNTAAVSDVTPGYYYWNGTTWTRLLNGATNLSGAGTTDYLARWTPSGSVLGIGATRDNGTNVGIGVAPTQKLTVAGNINKSGSWIAGDAVWGANTFEIHNSSWDGASNNNYGGITGGHGYYYGGLQSGGGGGNEAASGEFYVSGKSMLMGNVGVGTTGPNFKMDVQQDITMSGDINPGTAQLSVGGTTTVGKRMLMGYDINGNGFGFIKAGNYGVTWTPLSLQPNGGNVGIGTTTPNEKLEINGSVRGNQAGALRVSTGSGYIDLGPQNTSWAHLQTDRSQFYFNKQIGVDGHAFPYLDNTYDLGLSGNRWRNLYLSGTIQGPGATQFIQNQNASAQAANFWISGTGRIGTYGLITDIPTTYGSIGLNGAKNGYYSVLMGQTTAHANNMYDGAGNGGIYYENWGWSQYYLTGTRHMQINTSSDLGYSLGVSGTLRATAGQYLDYVNNGTLAVGGGSIGGTDAVIFAQDLSNNDWGIIINKGTFDYGQDIRVGSGASYALRVVGSGSEYFRVRGDGVSYQPFIYDINNTGYYLDPNGTSNSNAVIAYSYQGNGNVGGTGSASWHPSGIYSAGTNWLYGTSYMHTTYGYIWYDWNNTAYYVDPASTSELNLVTRGTLARHSLNALQNNSPVTTRSAQADTYRNGTMGWGTTDFNAIYSNWGSGFIDSWSNPGNAPGGSSHYVGIQGMHYNHQDGTNAYGFQMACAGEANNRFFWRSGWPGPRPWVEMIHTGNIASYAVGDNLGNHSATTTLNLNNNGLNGYGWLDPYGIGGNSGQGYRSYSIWQESGGWGWPYPDLIIRHHTGIRLSAEGSYGGVKILANNGEGQTAMFDNDGLHLNTGWFRPYGNNGIYWQSWGKGIHMTDGTWLRAYSSGGYYSDNTVQSRNVNWGDNNTYTHTGYLSGYMEGWSVSDGHRILPMNYDYGSTGYGYIGQYNRDWYYVYADYHTNTSRRETKKDITPLDESLYEYVMADIDKIKPTFYRYKGETRDYVEGNETKYKPQLTLGVILDESPDYIQDNAFSGVNIYSAAVLALTGVKYNREKIKEIESKISGLNEEFGNASSGSWITFDESFTSACGTEKPFITVTPTSAHDGSYYISEMSAKGFKVTSKSDLSFSWHAVAPAKKNSNSEKGEVAQVPSSILEQLKISEEKKKLLQNYFDKENNESTKTYEKNMAVWKETMPDIYESAVKENERSKALYLKYENEIPTNAIIPSRITKEVNGTSNPDKYPADTFQDPTKSTLNPDFYKTDPLVDPEFIKQEQLRIKQEQIDALKKTEEEKKKNTPVDDGTVPLSEEYYNSLKENLPK